MPYAYMGHCLTVKVSKNPETFFRHLWDREVARVLWIREACVNQRDEDDRQRNFMRFSMACRELLPGFGGR